MNRTANPTSLQTKTFQYPIELSPSEDEYCAFRDSKGAGEFSCAQQPIAQDSARGRPSGAGLVCSIHLHGAADALDLARLGSAYVIGIAPEITGRVVEVGVIDDSRVDANQVLFRIDPERYELAVAEAALASVGQSIGASTATVDAAQAKLVEIEADRVNLRDQFARASELVKHGVFSKARFDAAKSAYEASVSGARADLAKAREELGPAGNDNPQVRAALAGLEKARLDLVRTIVRAPSAGVITNLQLTIGKVVSAGQPAMTFLDVGTIWINAAFKENSLENVAAGNRAEIIFDALPGKLFPAKVESVGFGVSQGSTDPATGLPTMRNDSEWAQEAQRFPVRLNTYVNCPNYRGRGAETQRHARRVRGLDRLYGRGVFWGDRALSRPALCGAVPARQFATDAVSKDGRCGDGDPPYWDRDGDADQPPRRTAGAFLLLLGLAYFACFVAQSAGKGGPAVFLVLLVAIIVPLLGILNKGLANSILSMLVTGVLSGTILMWLAYAMFPEPAGQAIAVVSSSERPSDLLRALANTGLLLISVVICLTSDNLTAAAVIPITVASLLGQLDVAASSRAAVRLVLVNLFGGPSHQ